MYTVVVVDMAGRETVKVYKHVGSARRAALKAMDKADVMTVCLEQTAKPSMLARLFRAFNTVAA